MTLRRVERWRGRSASSTSPTRVLAAQPTTVALTVGEQQRGETPRGCGAQLDVDGAVSGHLLRQRGTFPGGDGAGVDYLEHDVRAAHDDEVAGLVEVEVAVVDEHLAAVLGADRAAEFGVGSRAASNLT